FKTTDGGTGWLLANVGLPVGAREVTTLAIRPLGTATLYAGAGGVFKTADAGVSWSYSATGSPVPLTPGYGVVVLEADPFTPSTLYATDQREGTISQPSASRLLKTTNDGASWSQLAGLPDTVGPVAVDPATPAVVYAGTGSGLFKSTDGGGSWNPSSA